MFAKKGLRREDFLFANGWFQQRVKAPKQLQMQQFQISDCEECNIFLFDSSACVYVDACKYCNIFVGPSESSIFIRDCSYLNVISISQQFRVRDCFNCKFSIFCESQPIIESSWDLKFLCYPQDLSYESLEDQMAEAKLNKWNNNWFDIYDFTPGKFKDKAFNYQLSAFEKEFILLKELFRKKMQLKEIQQNSKIIIPAVVGKVDLESGNSVQLNEVVFILLYPQIRPNDMQSMVLQSKYQPIPQELSSIVTSGFSPKEKVLFLKVRKEHESRWKLCDSILTIVKANQEKELIENIVFAPFSDEH